MLANVTKPEPDIGDIAWILTSSVFIFLMWPGLALFYAGLVDFYNVASTITFCFVGATLVSLQWVLIGYSLTFDGSFSGWIGNPSQYFGLLDSELSRPAQYGVTIGLDAFFQMMYAILPPSILVGVVCRRMKLQAWVVFVLIWTTLCYDICAHIMWNASGLLKGLATDFAGGLVIHFLTGVSALVVGFYLGPTQKQSKAAHSVPLYTLGLSMMFIGWIGFNGGSAYRADVIATTAVFNTVVAGCVGYLSWMFLETIIGRPTPEGYQWWKPSTEPAGIVVGLVAITASANRVPHYAAIIIAFCSALFVLLMKRLIGYVKCGSVLYNRDPLEVFIYHGLPSPVGALFLALWSEDILHTLKWQLVAICSIGLIAIVGTLVSLLITNLFMFVQAKVVSWATGKPDEQEGFLSYVRFYPLKQKNVHMDYDLHVAAAYQMIATYADKANRAAQADYLVSADFRPLTTDPGTDVTLNELT